jgi:hypothetical protein
MKIKKTIPLLCLICVQTLFAQEERIQKITDSINAETIRNIETQKPILESQKEAQDLINAKIEAEDRKKEIEKRQKQVEKQQERLEKEQKKQEKEKEKLEDARKNLAKAKDKLIDHQNDMLKDAEKYNKKSAKGKLSLEDIADFEKKQLKQNQKTEKLKESITKAEKRLARLID